MKIMTLRAPDKMQELLSSIAKKNGFTRNALIVSILWDWLEANENEKEEQHG